MALCPVTKTVDQAASDYRNARRDTAALEDQQSRLERELEGVSAQLRQCRKSEALAHKELLDAVERG